MRRAARRDANESYLLAELAKIGCDWQQAGPLDGWAWCPTGKYARQWVPTEIKNPAGRNRFQQSQKDFIALCAAQRRPYYIWRTLDDCIRDLTADPVHRMFSGEDFR